MFLIVELTLLLGLVIAGFLLYERTARSQRDLAVRLEHLQSEIEQLRRAQPAGEAPVPAGPAAPIALTPAGEPPVKAEPPPKSAEPAEASQTAEPEPVTDEQTIAMLAAVIAAHLGKRVKIRRARLLPTPTTAWAQQGRVIIQASHYIDRGGHH